MNTTSEVQLELAPVAESVTEARHAVAALARALGAPEQDVALAVSEAVGNAVQHAFRFGKTGCIKLRASRENGELLVIVTDDGVGLMPDLDNPGLGVGTSIISRLPRETAFESSDTGTTVKMRFELKGRKA